MSPSWEAHRDPGVEGHRSRNHGNSDCGEGHRDCFGGGSDPVYPRGEGTQTSPCEVFLMFFLFDSIVSDDFNSYFEVFLVLSKTQKTISGLPPFSPPLGCGREAAYPAAPPN